MEITDKLRELAKTLNHWWYNPLKDEYICTTSITPPSIHAINLAGSILSIADRIDAAHEEALSRAYMDVSDSKWLRLPKDIDGKPIEENDKVDWRDHLGTWHENATVVAVCGDGCYVMYGGMVIHVNQYDIRHHRDPDTWEQIIKDAMEGADRDGAPDTYQGCVAELVERCKALAGGDA